MYKNFLETLAKSETLESTNVRSTYSEKEVLDMLKDTLIKKSEKYKDIPIEELKKNWKKAFSNGLTILGMIHGAHYMGSGDKGKDASRELASTKPTIQQVQEQKKPTGSDTSYRNKRINSFLKAIAMNESSGGKNTRHERINSGIHAGDAAIGKYGLMPNTVKELANRMGKENPMNIYSSMENKNIAKELKENPEHQEKFANFLANHLNDKFGGDESKMAYAYNQGHNLGLDAFENKHSNYKEHDYVNKYHKHRSEIEKTPVVPNKPDQLASNKWYYI